MEPIKTLFEEYCAGNISSNDFVKQYMKLCRELRDEILERIASIPGLQEQIADLGKQVSNKQISVQQFSQQYKDLLAQVKGTRLKPLSKEEKILSHLFVESDAYREDPEEREPGSHIGDEELLAEVQQALTQLNALGV